MTFGSAVCIVFATIHGSVHAEETVLASSAFEGDSEEWTVDDDTVVLEAKGGALIGRDIATREGGPSVWNFVAPEPYLDDKILAFHGHLSFKSENQC